MKIFSDVSSLAAASLTANQIVKVKGVGDYQIKDSGAGITLANGKIAVPVASGTAVNVKQFGAVGDGVADDTAAIQAALTYASTIDGATGSGKGSSVYFPVGGYRVTSLTWPQHVSIIGEETRLTSIFWDGAEASGSALFNCSTGQSFAEIKSIALFGYLPTTGTTLVESLIRFTGASSPLDLNFKIEDVSFKGCKFNAIHQEEGQVVNFHLNRVRFDAVGGYGVRLKTFNGHEQRPVSIRNFTLDNNPSALPPSYSSSTRWGLGLLRIVDGGHTGGAGPVQVQNGRIEKNVYYQNTTYGDYTTGEPIASVHLEGNGSAGGGQYRLDLKNVVISGSGGTDSGEAIAASSGYTSSMATYGTFTNCQMSSSSAQVYIDNSSTGRDIDNTYSILDKVINQPEHSVVRADLSADQSGIVSGGFRTVQYNRDNTTTTIDTRNEYDTGTYTFTPTREGWYRVKARVTFTNFVDGAYCMLTLLKGAIRFRGAPVHGGSANTIGCEINDIIYMNGTTDTLKVEVFHNTGSDRTIDSEESKSILTIERIS